MPKRLRHLGHKPIIWGQQAPRRGHCCDSCASMTPFVLITSMCRQASTAFNTWSNQPKCVPLTLGKEEDSLCVSRSTPWTSAQSSTLPMKSDRRNRRRTRDPSASRSMSVAAVPSPFAADSGGSCPSSAAFFSRLCHK